MILGDSNGAIKHFACEILVPSYGGSGSGRGRCGQVREVKSSRHSMKDVDPRGGVVRSVPVNGVDDGGKDMAIAGRTGQRMRQHLDGVGLQIVEGLG